MYCSMQRKLTGITIVALTAVAFPSQSQLAPAMDTGKYHQTSLSLIRVHLRSIKAAVIDNQRRDKATVDADAVIIDTMLRQDDATVNWQIENSTGKVEIWKEQERLKAASETMLTKAQKLVVATASGDWDAIRAALHEVDQACAACHTKYRVK